MYYLKTSAEFDSAHFLAGYKGKCANIHGHRWKVEVTVAADALIESGEKRGMVIDFGDLKHEVRALAALRNEDFRLIEVAYRPTAENFAMDFFGTLREKGLPVKTVTVYETPENCAVYEEEI